MARQKSISCPGTITFSSPELKVRRRRRCFFRIFMFFLRSTRPISTKFGIRHPWVKGTQVCSYEGPRLFPIGHTNETDLEKIHGRNLNIFFLRSTGSYQPNLAQSIHGWWGFKFVHTLFQWGDNNEIAEIHLRILKISFFKYTYFNQTWQKTSLCEVKGIQVCSNEGSCLFRKGYHNLQGIYIDEI